MFNITRHFTRSFHEFSIKRILELFLTFLISVVIFNKFLKKEKYKFHGELQQNLESPLRSVNEIKISMLSSQEQEKLWKNILLWTPYFGYGDAWKKVFRRHLNKECKETRCKIFTNRKKYLQADAILFNANDLAEKPTLLNSFSERFVYPKRRLPTQIYIFFSFEPPPNVHMIALDEYHHFFNWTMSYRRDSDVYAPYAEVVRNKKKDPSSKYFPSTREELKSKKMAAWMVSHCPTDSKREILVRRLQSYFPVDVYGKCGPLRCGAATTLPRIIPGVADPCDNVTKEYIFYLSLENALCKDYVTEKFYRALKLGIIPVVMGGVNYSSFAPPNSFIDIKDFESVAALAEHMKEVAKDINLYNEYFKWKDYYEIDIGHPYKPLICGLCEKLQETHPLQQPKIYEDIGKWYRDNASCHTWKE